MYGGINNFKKSYQLIDNVVKDEKGDFVINSNTIPATWRNHFSQLFSVNGVDDVRQTEIHTTGTLVPEPSAFEVKIVLKS